MTIQLNHHIIHVHDKQESAQFLSEILGSRPRRHTGLSSSST